MGKPKVAVFSSDSAAKAWGTPDSRHGALVVQPNVASRSAKPRCWALDGMVDPWVSFNKFRRINTNKFRVPQNGKRL
jgi:hypothetical protein